MRKQKENIKPGDKLTDLVVFRVQEKRKKMITMNHMRMRLLFLLFALLCNGPFSHAQTWGEWFNQKATQKKYLLEQIAALKVYSGYLKKGYDVVQDGSRLIGDIRRGDLDLHSNYFNSQVIVSGPVKNQDKIKQIIRIQHAMLDMRRSCLSSVKKSNQLSAQETADLKMLLENLESEAEKDIGELELIVTDGKITMTDDERMSRIDKLYLAILGKYGFQKRLNSDVANIITVRLQAAKDKSNSMAIFGLKD